MRATNELARLNKIWERFNETKEDPLPELLSYKWKYHKDRALLLADIASMYKDKSDVPDRLIKNLFS